MRAVRAVSLSARRTNKLSAGSLGVTMPEFAWWNEAGAAVEARRGVPGSDAACSVMSIRSRRGLAGVIVGPNLECTLKNGVIDPSMSSSRFRPTMRPTRVEHPLRSCADGAVGALCPTLGDRKGDGGEPGLVGAEQGGSNRAERAPAAAPGRIARSGELLVLPCTSLRGDGIVWERKGDQD